MKPLKPKKVQTPVDNREGRRSRGHRGPAVKSHGLAPLPRFIRRHGHKVIPVSFTVRAAIPGRRERKIAAKVGRLAARRGLVG